MNRIVPAALIAFLLSIWTMTSVSASRTSLWTCELNAFVVGDASQYVKTHPTLDGRGLVSCQNVSGFDMEIPIVARLITKRETTRVRPEQLKATVRSGPFILGHDINQLYDIYSKYTDLRKATSGTPETSLSEKPSAESFTMIGKNTGVLLPAQIVFATSAGQHLKIENLALDFDTSAPDIEK